MKTYLVYKIAVSNCSCRPSTKVMVGVVNALDVNAALSTAIATFGAGVSVELSV
jgi:hypothetical protein